MRNLSLPHCARKFAASWFAGLLLLPVAFSQYFPGGGDKNTGLPCKYIDDLGVPYVQRGRRCFIGSKGMMQSEKVDLSDQINVIVGGGTLKATKSFTDNARDVGNGRSRISDTNSLSSVFDVFTGIGNPFASNDPMFALGAFKNLRGLAKKVENDDDDFDDRRRHLLSRSVQCPIKMHTMRDELQPLASPCSVSITDNALFAKQCLQKLEYILARRYHAIVTKMGTSRNWQSGGEDVEATKACAEDAINFLGIEFGVPVRDDNFVGNVLMAHAAMV